MSIDDVLQKTVVQLHSKWIFFINLYVILMFLGFFIKRILIDKIILSRKNMINLLQIFKIKYQK